MYASRGPGKVEHAGSYYADDDCRVCTENCHERTEEDARRRPVARALFALENMDVAKDGYDEENKGLFYDGYDFWSHDKDKLQVRKAKQRLPVWGWYALVPMLVILLRVFLDWYGGEKDKVD